MLGKKIPLSILEARDSDNNLKNILFITSGSNSYIAVTDILNGSTVSINPCGNLVSNLGSRLGNQVFWIKEEKKPKMLFSLNTDQGCYLALTNINLH